MKHSRRSLSSKAGSRLLDILCTILLCIPVGMVIFHLLAQDVALWECALCAAAAVLICALVTTKGFTLPILIGLPILGVGAYFFLQWRFPAALSYAEGFVRWCLGGLPLTDPFSFDFSIHVVHFGILLLPAAVFFLFYRKLYHLIPLLLVSAAVIVYAEFNSLPSRYILLGILLVLVLTGLAQSTHRSLRKTLKGKTILPEAAMRFAAMIFSTLMVVAALQIAFAPDGKWVSKGLHRFTADVQDFFSYYLDGDSASTGSHDWSGFLGDDGRLGGDFEPDNTVLLRIQTDQPVLLTGCVYDSYDGGAWYDTARHGNFRWGSILWNSRQREAFATTNPRGGREGAQRYEKISYTAALDIKPRKLYRTVFFTGSPVSWELGKGCADLYFNSQGEIYMSEKPGSGVNYSLRAETFDTRSETFEQDLLAMEEVTLNARDPLYEKVAETYTALPDTLPDLVWETAKELTAGAETPAEKAFAIQRWLQENCTYTTKPGAVPEGEDFVSWFLQTRKGYCTYYASAMAVLARCAGLPARYVTGFGMKQNPELKKNPYAHYNYLVTNACAHAWAEVYLTGIGWVPFEVATFDSFEPAILPSTSSEQESTPPKDKILTPDDLEEETVIPGAAQIAQPGISNERLRIPSGPIIAVLAAIALILLLIGVRYLYLRAKPNWLLRRMRRRWPSRKNRANALYYQILDQCELLGLRYLPGETLRGFLARMPSIFPEDENADPDPGKPLLAIERLHYGLREPSDEEFTALARLSVRLEKQLREDLGRRGYFRRRVIKPRRNTRRIKSA